MGNSLTNILYEKASSDEHSKPVERTLEEINVLTFNIFVRPPMINNNGDDFKDERIQEFFRIAHQYDVICLQEMFNAYSSRRELFIDRAYKAGFRYYAAAPKPATLSYHFIDAGLIVLSRYPIEASEFCPLPPGHGVDYFVQKGILYAKVKVGNASLHVYNTHGQANYDPNPMTAFLIRTEQLLTFQKFIKSTLAKNHYSEGDLALLMGDYNVDSRSKHRFQSRALSDVPGLKGLGCLTKLTNFGEYDALLGVLSDNHKDEIEDLLYKDAGEHPVTFGESAVVNDGEVVPLETVLTTKKDWGTNQCLDYIFRFAPTTLDYEPVTPQEMKVSATEKLSVVDGTTKVEKFLVTGQVFDQLSDHYGIQVTVALKRVELTDGQESDSTVSSPTKSIMKSP